MKKAEQRYPPVSPLFEATKAILLWLIRTLTRLHVEGTENVPAEGPLMLVSNHLHHLDAPVVGVTLPRRVHALAAEKYEYHVFGLFLRITGAIFINRGEVDRRALRQAMAVLEDGRCLAVAVEGTRSATGGLARGKTGAAYLATRANAPLVPVVVWGAENIIPCWARLRRADVYVRYGKPFRLPEGRARAEQLEEYTAEIMATLASMLPEQYRGVYRDHPLVTKKLAAQARGGAPPRLDLGREGNL